MSECNHVLRGLCKPYPRTCALCGIFGPCRRENYVPSQNERVEEIMRLVFAYGRCRVDVDRSNSAANQRAVDDSIAAIRAALEAA